MERRIGTWTTLLQVSAMLHKVWDKKRNLKIAEPPKKIGKVETGRINRGRRKTMITVLEVEVTINITYINLQQTNPIKMTKKKWPTLAEALKVERRKKWTFFGKIRPYKQRQEERLETVETENYGESNINNNDQQNEHTIIVPDTQDVSNQIEENTRISARDNFFLHSEGATKANQRKNWLFILRFRIYLA